MTDKPYVPKRGGSTVIDASGKAVRSGGTKEPEGGRLLPGDAPATAETQTAETSQKKGK